MGKRYFLLSIAIATMAWACSRNSITGRKQLSLVSEDQLQEVAKTEYRQFLSQSNVVGTGNKDAEMVKRVGSRIATAINNYYTKQNAAQELQGYQWEFNLVDSKDVNAWCMPGGKVVVYTGLLPVTQNEAALAVVVGHEITHAVAAHGRERMSQALLAQGIQVGGNVLLGGNQRAVNIFNSVYGPGAQVGVLLPNSRKQELEADRFGLIFAAMAGYNPQEAVPFWKRMMALSTQKPPVFLSSHPGDEERIQHLQDYMPEAMKYYKPIKK